MSGQRPGSYPRSRPRPAPARRRCRRRPGQPRPWLRALALPRAPGRRCPPAGAARTEPLLRRRRHPVVHQLREHQVKVRVVRHPGSFEWPACTASVYGNLPAVTCAAKLRARSGRSAESSDLGSAAVSDRKGGRCPTRGCRPPPSTGRVRRRKRRHATRLEVHHLVLPIRLVVAAAADVVVLRRRRQAGAAREGLHVDVAIHGVVLLGPISLVARRFRTAKPVSAPFGFRGFFPSSLWRPGNSWLVCCCGRPARYGSVSCHRSSGGAGALTRSSTRFRIVASSPEVVVSCLRGGNVSPGASPQWVDGMRGRPASTSHLKPKSPAHFGATMADSPLGPPLSRRAREAPQGGASVTSGMRKDGVGLSVADGSGRGVAGQLG